MTAKKKSRLSDPSQVTEPWASQAILPHWEIWIYIIGWVGAVAYSIYSVYRASTDHIEELNDYFLVSGWSFLGRKKDTSNFEWDFWTGWYIEIGPWLAGHLVLSFLCKRISTKKRDWLFTIYSQVILFTLLGGQAICVIWSHVIIIYFVTYFRSKVIVWLTSLSLLSTLNVDRTVNILKQVVDHDPFEKKFYLLLFLLAMANLRYTSAALEITMCKIEASQLEEEKNKRQNSSIEEKTTMKNSAKVVKTIRRTDELRPMRGSHRFAEKSSHAYNLLDVAVYVFYPVLMFTGPIVTFDSFYKQFHQHHHHHHAPTSLSRLSTIIMITKRCLRIAFWFLVLEFGLHYLYFNCIHLDVNIMNRLPLWAVAGLGYCHGQFFMVKYVVLFGAPAILASIDGIETATGPKCIARIYLYSDMWKYFDRGLYSFLKRYIYVPIGGSQSGVVRQLLASCFCFAFVYVWHGAEDYLLIWTSLNLVGIIIETLGAHVSQIPWISELEHKYISAGNSRRIRCLISTPLLTMSCIAIFYFFGGRQVGYCYFYRLIIEGFPQATVNLTIAFYCCIQVSKEVEAWEARKLHQD